MFERSPSTTPASPSDPDLFDIIFSNNLAALSIQRHPLMQCNWPR
jgi:hypothetical protein